MAGRSRKSHVSEQQAAKFDMLQPLIRAAHDDMVELSKKKPDAPVNETKVRLINHLLSEAAEILSGDPVSAYVSVLDEETLPTNSDAVLILGQFLQAMYQFGRRHLE